MATVPLKGMVTLLAEIVKLGAGVGAIPTAHAGGTSAERTMRQESALFGSIGKPP
jgi:hypothetical protein